MAVQQDQILSFAHLALGHLRDGRFQRSLALIAGLSALMSGLEVAQQHYRGSYGQKIMYSPLVFCGALGGIAIWAAFAPADAKDVLLYSSGFLILDGVTGFGFHIRGIARKPGGWCKNLIFNIVMGPPIFAPLLLSVAGLLGAVATQLQPEEAAQGLSAGSLENLRLVFAIATAVSALLNGCEALYSHYKSRFAKRSQWIPIVLAPPLFGVAFAFLFLPDAMRVALEGLSVAAILAGLVGTGFHLYGIYRRPGGLNNLFYNIIYGPPAFAPLLFAATGFLGLLATQMGQL